MSDAQAPLAIPTSIKERRKKLRWSQGELADRMGVSTTTIHNLEAGKNGFSDKTLALAAKALGCRPADLLLPIEDKPCPIVGEEQILAMLQRIEGLSERGVELAFLAITTALETTPSPKQQQRGADDRSSPTTPRRESTSSR